MGFGVFNNEALTEGVSAAVARLVTPARKYIFEVVCPALGNLGSFSKISGIKEEIEVVEKRDGSQPFVPRKIVGQAKGGVLTLEKGVIANVTVLTRWFAALKGRDRGTNYHTSIAIAIGTPLGSRSGGSEGSPGKATGTVILAREIVLRGAWPSSYSLGDLDAKSSDVAVESLVIQFESLDFNEKFVNKDINRFSSEEFTGHPKNF